MAKLALLIGDNDYQYIKKLQYAVNDAEAIAASLRRNYGFRENEIVLMTSDKYADYYPTRETIVKRLADTSRSGQHYELLVIGFFGHGVCRPNA